MSEEFNIEDEMKEDFDFDKVFDSVSDSESASDSEIYSEDAQENTLDNISSFENYDYFEESDSEEAAANEFAASEEALESENQDATEPDEALESEETETKTEESASKESSAKPSKNKKRKSFFGIRQQLLLAFVVPVALMIVLGMVSYKKSSESLTEAYESSTINSLGIQTSLFESILNNIQTASYDTVNSTTARNYFGGKYITDGKADTEAFYTLITEVDVRKNNNRYIDNIIFTTNYGRVVRTGASSTEVSVYDEFIQTETAQEVKEKDIIWVGNHEDIDGILGTSNYAFSVIRKQFSHSNFPVGYVVIDVSYDVIYELINNVDIGDNAIAALITPDGKEISYKRIPGASEEDVKQVVVDENNYIVGTPVYDMILNSGETTENKYIDYNGEEYFLSYNLVDSKGFYVVGLVPKATIVEDAHEISKITVIAVVFTAIIVIALGLFISLSMSRTISSIMAGLDKAADGDFTYTTKTKRKDEFKVLSDNVNNTIANVRGLLTNAAGVSKEVENTAGSVADNTTSLLNDTVAITNSIGAVEQGIVLQAQDAESCLTRMDQLTKKMEVVFDNTERISTISSDTKLIVSDGLVTIDELKAKAKDTSDVTDDVIKNIEELANASNEINKIINAINEIADETSLLSLNASIEAARAGEAGRGFAVVADSIRKLSEQSVNSVNEIRNIVDNITKQTTETVEIAKRAEGIVSSQEEALSKTVKVFNDINSHFEELTTNLSLITAGIDEMDVAKNETLSALESISAVSQENASATEEVNEAAERQLSSVEALKREAEELINQSEQLVDAISKFRV